VVDRNAVAIDVRHFSDFALHTRTRRSYRMP
jgi:hypothetical protein